MGIKECLKEKTIFITGATGFLGQPLVEKILWAAPDVRRIYVLIRPKKQFGGRVLTPQQRLEKELYNSSVFERLQDSRKEQFEEFLREKLVAVGGDIAEENLGIDESMAEQLREEVDVVINSAAVVSFDAPLDSALELNIFGAAKVTKFATSCKHAILIHVSTAYVCGAAVGPVYETMHHTAPPDADGEQLRQFRDIDAEIGRIQETIKSVGEQAEEPGLRRKFLEELVRKLRKWRGKKQIRRRQELDNLKRKWTNNRLCEEGMSLARKRGWNDTYTYTKALGEQIVVRAAGDLPMAIVRPSVIESSLSEPSPGWLDGLRMADPLIVAIGKGRLRTLPLNPDVGLDLVPADMVVNAILAALLETATSQKKELRIYQVATGSKNPTTLGELYKLIYGYFAGNPMLDRDGQPILLKPMRFPKPSTFRIQHRLKSVPLNTAERTLEKLAVFDATHKMKRRISAKKVAHEKLYYYGEIYEPYLNLDCQFQVDNSLALYETLSEEEKREFNFDVRRLNWRHYIQNVHIPGVKKFILKIEGTGTLELPKEETLPEDEPRTIPDVLARAAEKAPHRVALQIKRDGQWVRYTYGDLQDRAREVSVRLRSFGLVKGDRVVIFSENLPEWGIAYLGGSSLGLVAVPVDSQTWEKEVWSVARFTEAKAMLVSERCLKRLSEEGLRDNERSDDPILLLNVNRFCEPHRIDGYPRSSKPQIKIPVSEDFEFPEVQPGDEASIIFTTGTAVDPKGAVHVHRNFLNNLRGANHYLFLSESDQLLSVLPLYHALEFTCGFLAVLYCCATVTYVHSMKPRVILETMRETGTTCLLGVPTLFALIREDIERRILKVSKSPLKSNWMATSKRLSHSVKHRLGRDIGQTLFSKVHSEFGGRIRLFVSGGSGLGEDLYRDFSALGMPIYEGYGLTETAPVLTVNPLHRSREGSAGKPLPGVELRLSHPDHDGIGEIIVKTPSLFKEYYKNPESTAAVMRDGWFNTGDLGWVDADGYVYITGRTKDVIVTGAGKNVYPSDLEAIYETLPEVKEVCVFGVKSGLTEDVHAVVHPNLDGIDSKKPEELRKLVQQGVQRLARELPSYDRLQAIHIVTDPLPRDESGKIDRQAVRAETLGLREKKGAKVGRPSKATSRRDNLYEVLTRLTGVSADEINDETNLYTDLGLDSLMALELLLFLERELGIVIPDEKVAAFQTVGDVLDELRKRGFGQAAEPEARNGEPRSVLPFSQRPAVDRALMGASFGALKSLFRHYFDLEVADAELLPRQGPYILAANHSSHLDTAAVVAALSLVLGVKEAQKMHVIGASDYFFDSRLKGWLFSTCLNVVPIEREEVSLAGLRRVRGILSKGEPILIFPEGTRSRDGTMHGFKPGVGLIALELNTPIIPAFIEGTFTSLPAGKAVPRKGRVTVRFGPEISMDPYLEAADDVSRDEVYRRIARDLRTAIEGLGSGG